MAWTEEKRAEFGRQMQERRAAAREEQATQRAREILAAQHGDAAQQESEVMPVADASPVSAVESAPPSLGGGAAPAEPAPHMALTQYEDDLPDPAAEPAPEEPATPFEVYVASLSDDTRELFTLDELQEEFEKAAIIAKAERRKQAKAAAAARALQHARAAEGLESPTEVANKALREKMTQMVRVKIQMPFMAGADNGSVVDDGVTIDGTKYLHGQEYTMPMGRALDIRAMLFNLHQHELTFEGKGRLNGLRQQRASAVNLVDFRGGRL